MLEEDEILYHNPMKPYAGKVVWSPVAYLDAQRLQAMYTKKRSSIRQVISWDTSAQAGLAKPAETRRMQDEIRKDWDDVIAPYLVVMPSVPASTASTSSNEQSDLSKIEFCPSKVHAVLGPTATDEIYHAFRAVTGRIARDKERQADFL